MPFNLLVEKKIIYTIIVLFAALVIYAWPLVHYGFVQARGQLMVLWQAQPIEYFLENEDFPGALKEKIELIQEIKSFARDSLGLKLGEHYSTIYDQQGEDILWNVSACKPYKLESYQWRFPLLGSFGYKGFFDRALAEEEEQRLAAEGYDTNIRPVNAWSTLGWFNDPILSNMLYRSEGALAELIIHELTHATIFVKDSLVFNENLASFVGEKGAEAFLAYKYGKKAPQLAAYRNSENDYRKFLEHMINGANTLDSLYLAIEDLPIDEKGYLKDETIQKIIQNLDTVSFQNPDRFVNAYADSKPNNTRFMSFKRYHGQYELLENIYLDNFDGSIKAYILHLKEIYGK